MKLFVWIVFMGAFMLMVILAKEIWTSSLGFWQPDFSWHRAVEAFRIFLDTGVAAFLLSFWWNELNRKPGSRG